jgi:hypothetical protein
MDSPNTDQNKSEKAKRELKFLLSMKLGETKEDFKARVIEVMRLHGMLRD